MSEKNTNILNVKKKSKIIALKYISNHLGNNILELLEFLTPFPEFSIRLNPKNIVKIITPTLEHELHQDITYILIESFDSRTNSLSALTEKEFFDVYDIDWGKRETLNK
ncbi:MAG: hypothetical protein WC783_00280 [Candidatus Paceibacterota bacterium]|jgi:hypothetical protein